MAASLEQLARYHQEIGNLSRAQLFRTLAAEERGMGTPEELEAASKRDLRQETLDLLAGNTFREPDDMERQILATGGYDIFLPTRAITLCQVVDENRGHFWSDESDFVNARPSLRDYVPPALEVALRSTQLFLEGSFNKSQVVQLLMHMNESQVLQKQLPDARNIMLPASTGAQLDLEYLKRTGQVLFRDRSARALDETSGVGVAYVGRDHPGFPLRVFGWYRDFGIGGIGTLSAVVMVNRQ